MAFDPLPTALFPGLSNGTNTVIFSTADAAGDKSLPELSDAEANAVTGDSRKIIYALCEQAYQWYLALAAADRPGRVNIFRASQVDETTGLITKFYTFQITTESTGGLDVADEAV